MILRPPANRLPPGLAAQPAVAFASDITTGLFLQSAGILGVATSGAETARFNASGRLLLGTGTDSNNGRIQLATHSTSAGGIGFGDFSIHRSAAQTLMFSGGAVTLQGAASENFTLSSSASLILRSGSATACTFDSAQHAAFAQGISVCGATPKILGGTADPGAGAGLAAPLGSFYMRAAASGGTAAEAFFKTGAGDTAWQRIALFAG